MSILLLTAGIFIDSKIDELCCLYGPLSLVCKDLATTEIIINVKYVLYILPEIHASCCINVDGHVLSRVYFALQQNYERTLLPTTIR